MLRAQNGFTAMSNEPFIYFFHFYTIYTYYNDISHATVIVFRNGNNIICTKPFNGSLRPVKIRVLRLARRRTKKKKITKNRSRVCSPTARVFTIIRSIIIYIRYILTSGIIPAGVNWLMVYLTTAFTSYCSSRRPSPMPNMSRPSTPRKPEGGRHCSNNNRSYCSCCFWKGRGYK